MNKKTFYKERKINNRCFDFLSKQNIIIPQTGHKWITLPIAIKILLIFGLVCFTDLLYILGTVRKYNKDSKNKDAIKIHLHDGWRIFLLIFSILFLEISCSFPLFLNPTIPI